MGQIYWITEYVKVLLAYGFVMYLWPAVVFEKHLKGKSRTYRFSFCVTVPIMIVNTGVLFLGLMHLLHPVFTAALFFAAFLIQLYRYHGPSGQWFQDMRKALTGTMGKKSFAVRYFSELRRRAADRLSAWWKSTKGRRLEYLLLLALVAYGTIYFSYGAFDGHSYGFGDQYVHHQWIYGLTQGRAFDKGIYPEAMHCMIYLTCTAFGIRLYSGVLFFAGVHIHVLLVSAYLFMKEVFHWSYSALFTLAMFLTFDQLCINEVFGMSRLSWTLPMEYALYTPFLCALFLMRFLREVLRGKRVRSRWSRPRGWRTLFREENLFLFMMAIAVSVAVHFYATIIAFFFCLAVVLVFLPQALRRGSFLPLILSVLLAFVMGAAPMGAAFAFGYPMQGSIGWALNVMKGEDQYLRPREVEVFQDPSKTETRPPEDAGEPSPQEAGEARGGLPEDGEERPAAGGGAAEGTAPSFRDRALARLALLRAKAEFYLEVFYRVGYNELYPGERSGIIVLATALALAVSAAAHAILRIVGWIRALLAKRRRKKADAEGTGDQGEAPAGKVYWDYFDGYLAVALLSVMIMFLYSATAFGLPELIAGSRLCSTEQMLLVALYAIPADWAFSLLALGIPKPLLKLLSGGLCVGIYLFAQSAGIFHSYLYYELTRYNAAVEATNYIIDAVPKHMYTIISTTDELYQVIEHGYHEELMVFAQREADVTYTLPTPYVFLYIEKRPILYAQSHFSQGPSWLAWERNPQYYGSAMSQCPDVLKGEISAEAAEESIIYGRKLSDSSTSMKGRTILESKAYRWYKAFHAKYPYEGKVVYEDDDFLCYCFVQNVNSLYTLGIFAEALS